MTKPGFMQLFRNPSAEYRGVACWAWNTNLDIAAFTYMGSSACRDVDCNLTEGDPVEAVSHSKLQKHQAPSQP